MRAHVLRSILMAGLLAFAGSGVAAEAPPQDETDRDLGRHWHFRIAGNGGTAFVRFAIPNLGVFTAQGFGHSRAFDADFAVRPVDFLRYESDSNIRGTIALWDMVPGAGGDLVAGTTQIGTLEITSGALTPDKQRLRLSGTMTIGGAAARRVRLIGTRPLVPLVERQGGSFDGHLRGGGARSSKYQVFLTSADTTAFGDEDVVETTRFPFYALDAGGPVRIDGVESPVVTMDGLLIADARGKLCGSVSVDSRLGARGACLGGFFFDPLMDAVRPGVNAMVTTDTRRRLRVSAAPLKEFASDPVETE